MFNPFFKSLNQLDGLLTVALVDAIDGAVLEYSCYEGCDVDIDLAAQGNAETLRYKIGLLKQLNLQDYIEDMLFTFPEEYHIIRPLASNETLFLYARLSRDKATLAYFRYKLAEFDKELNYIAY